MSLIGGVKTYNTKKECDILMYKHVGFTELLFKVQIYCVIGAAVISNVILGFKGKVKFSPEKIIYPPAVQYVHT